MIDLHGDLTTLNGGGLTPLGTATALGSTEAVEILVAAGAQ